MSVLMVTHDHERYISEALASAVDQGPDILEVIVVDDGSSDGTVDRALAVRDPRIRVIRSPNRGITGLAQNYDDGLAECRGDVVGLLEGDDRWPAGKIATQIAAFDDPAVVLSHGLYSVISARGRLLHAGVRPSVPIPTGTYDARPHILRASYVMAVTVLLRRDALLRSGGFTQLSSTPHWDYPTFLRLSEEGPFHFRPVVLGEWRRHHGSATYRLAATRSSQIDLAVARSTDLALTVRARMGDDTLPNAGVIRASWREAEGHGVWQNARILLSAGDFGEVRRLVADYWRRPYPFALRLRLAVAWLAAALHIDLERILSVVRGSSALEELD